MLKPNNSTTKNLIHARELIADKKNWCQGHGGEYRGRVCAVVAVHSTKTDPASGEVACEMLRDASMELFGKTTINVNDTLGHAAVMQVYDRAIEMSLREGL